MTNESANYRTPAVRAAALVAALVATLLVAAGLDQTESRVRQQALNEHAATVVATR